MNELTNTAQDQLTPNICTLPVLRDCERFLSAIGGIAFRIVPTSVLSAPPPGISWHPFCALIRSNRVGFTFCESTTCLARGCAERKHTPQTIGCLAGLQEIVVPIFAGTQHIANLFAGPFLDGRFQQDRMQRLMEELRRWNVSGDMISLQIAYGKALVLDSEQIKAGVRLLGAFADHLGRVVTRRPLSEVNAEPECVRKARDFVQNARHPITMSEAAGYVHMSAAHFSKTFRKATRVTFTDYVNTIRIEEAKRLLESGGDRVTDVAFTVGFGSIPTFNRVFRKITGVSPSEYRTTQRP